MKFNWIKDNIESLLICAGSLAFVIYFLISSHQIEKLKKNLLVAEANNAILLSTNQEQTNSINMLQKQRLQDEAAIAKNREDIKKALQNQKHTQSKINELEKNDEKVKDYLDNSIPNNLQCLLGICAETSGGSK